MTRALARSCSLGLLLSLALAVAACTAHPRLSGGPAGGGAAREVPQGAIPVEVVQRQGRWLFLRGGEPYAVRGAGIEFGNVEAMAAHGGNSLRTWRTDNGRDTGREVLDRAWRAGVTVAMCIEIGRERHGFDYDDETAVARQWEYAKQEVLKYRDHPALLFWMIGNEPNQGFTNPRVFDAIEDISRMIHRLDGNHPTTTALAGFGPELADLVRERSPDLDFISIQMYAEIVELPRYLRELEWSEPYVVSEWGSRGHWEVGQTAWGAPVEPHSSAKADHYLKSYQVAIDSDPHRILGSYVFLWGQKQERTPTWYGMFLEDGSETETVDVMHYIWNGVWPENRSPRVSGMTLDGMTAMESPILSPGRVYPVSLEARDADGDPLTYHWQVMRESQSRKEGGDVEAVPAMLPGLVENQGPGQALVTAPGPGLYRLFVYVYDGRGHAGHANIPFMVEDRTSS